MPKISEDILVVGGLGIFVIWTYVFLPVIDQSQTSGEATMTILQICYYLSQILLAIVAICAAFVAYAQLKSSKLFEMLKYLESSDIRKARRTVMREIYFIKNQDWWEKSPDKKRFEHAASDVCASYDILGRMIEFDRLGGVLETFFERHWARSIVDTHDALEGFLEHRRKRAPAAYSAFTRLALAARRHITVNEDVPLQRN
jgi:hypothetical protein